MPSDNRRIQYYRNERNIGAGPNYNRTFELSSGGEISFYIATGISQSEADALESVEKFCSKKAFEEALDENRQYWRNKTCSISFDTGDRDHDSWMRWVTLQPVLRRIFGCSFLPDHDYGKGGKGWRDIWQDLLH